MARLQIAETPAKDILQGQKASIDTRNGIDRALPPGAVPDLSVDGTIELKRLANVVYVGRPASGQPNGQMSLFHLEPDGKEAARVVVRLGCASVNAIEILEGLKRGDQVILSDMSTQDQSPRIRLN